MHVKNVPVPFDSKTAGLRGPGCPIRSVGIYFEDAVTHGAHLIHSKTPTPFLFCCNTCTKPTLCPPAHTSK